MKINKILAFLGLSNEISEKLSADQIAKLEAAEEKLTALEEATASLTIANSTLAEAVTAHEATITEHVASIAAKDVKIAELENTIAEGPAASPTTVVTEGDTFAGEGKTREPYSWELKGKVLRK